MRRRALHVANDVEAKSERESKTRTRGTNQRVYSQNVRTVVTSAFSADDVEEAAAPPLLLSPPRLPKDRSLSISVRDSPPPPLPLPGVGRVSACRALVTRAVAVVPGKRDWAPTPEATCHTPRAPCHCAAAAATRPQCACALRCPVTRSWRQCVAAETGLSMLTQRDLSLAPLGPELDAPSVPSAQ